MYVVTGATGNTGNVVATTLLKKGLKVRVVGRNASRLQSLVSAGAEPFIADLADRDKLKKALDGAKAVYAMIPPNITSTDGRKYQDGIKDAIAAAIEHSGVKFAVTLSSVGADKADKTGPVVGLHNFENRLNGISGLNVLHLRAGYFMENTLAQASIIRMLNSAGGPLRADLKVPMIATRDIGVAAAERLLQLDFQGHQTRELLGPTDLDMNQVAAIIGKAIGKANLKYVQIPDAQVRGALLQLGMSDNMANLLLEMTASLNNGHMRALEPRSKANSTPTPFEVFVAEEFLPLYHKQTKAA